MGDGIVDMRSDTVTQPTEGMRHAMMAAPLGDDVLGDDPTVLELEARIADLFGKSASCFVPSGTMANQAAIRAHSEPGDEIIAHEGSHIVHYEGGAPAALSGCSVTFIPSADGRFEASDLDARMRPIDDHAPRSRLLVLENTHNRGGGTVWPVERVESVTSRARELGLRCHLDGARIWNACVAADASPRAYASCFDSVSACFSKGLGAPVGSIVAGDEPFIGRVRRFRKMFGGGMRQSGLLAAAALYGVGHHFERLSEDHARARRLAEGLAAMPGVSLDASSVETNIVYFGLRSGYPDAAAVCERLRGEGVWMLPVGGRVVRAVLHLQVDDAGVERALSASGLVLGGA